MRVQVLENCGGYSKRLYLFESPFFSLNRPTRADVIFKDDNTVDIIPYNEGKVKIELYKKYNIGILYHQKIKLIVPNFYFCRLVMSANINFLRIFNIEYGNNSLQKKIK